MLPRYQPRMGPYRVKQHNYAGGSCNTVISGIDGISLSLVRNISI
jgi:hypothetical protein